MKKKPGSKIENLNTWVRDARWVHREWKQDSWTSEEYVDGVHYSQADKDSADAAGITKMLTINRIFPVVQLILGSYEVNQRDIDAKARTHKDAETADIMTQGIKFVLNQNLGKYKITKGFRDSVVPGFGCLEVGENRDPRQEKIKISVRDWKDVEWDPFGSIWWHPDLTRYVYYQPWIDLDDLVELFPERKREIEDKFGQLSGASYTQAEQGDFLDLINDVGTYSEDYKQQLIGSHWVDKQRKRVRPVELWHTKWVQTAFALFPDGNVIELTDDVLASDKAVSIVMGCQQLIKTKVKKMVVSSFFGDLMLQDEWSPHKHDTYPFVPFVGYLDRYGLPYGVPKQIRDENLEIDKRRTMALALLGKHRTIMETDVADDAEGREQLHIEAQKANGMLVLASDPEGKPVQSRIMVEDRSAMARGQLEMMQMSEREIQEVSGANGEQLGYTTNAKSGVAMQERRLQSSTILAPLFGHLNRSLTMLGELNVAMMQQHWTYHKVLRVTDRLTNAERWVEINKQEPGPDGSPKVTNDITQGRYDIVVSETPAADTVREKYVEMVIEWVKKSPPEVIPQLMNIAFELSALPNKDALLEKIRPLLGANPLDEEKTKAQRKQEIIEELERQKQQQAAQGEKQKIIEELALTRMRAEIEQLKAKIANLKADTEKKLADAEAIDRKTAVAEDNAAMSGIERGIKLGRDIAGPAIEGGDYGSR